MLAAMRKASDLDDQLGQRWARQGFDRLLSVQRPAVLAHLRSIRRGHPEAPPEEILHVLEQRYLAAVTTGGAATGAAAALPGIGTAASIALSGVETAGFLEASALFAQSVAELHGIAVEDPERSKALVMALMLGDTGATLVQQFAKEASGNGPSRSAYWGELVTKRLPAQLLKRLTQRIRRSFVRRFAARQGASIVLRAVPFGIGAVVGGTGNHLAGRKIVAATRDAFGPPPPTFPDQITVEPRRRAIEPEPGVAPA
jgi:hypothetical protein